MKLTFYKLHKCCVTHLTRVTHCPCTPSIKTHIQEIPALERTMTKSAKSAFRRINNTRFIQNIKESHSKGKASGNHSDRYNQPYQLYNSHSIQTTIVNKKVHAHENLMTNPTDHTSHAHPGPIRNSTTKKTSH